MRSLFHMRRRRFLGSALAAPAALALSVVPTRTSAQQRYPEKPVRIIATLAVGGSGDARVRLLAEKLSARLGQRFFVDNKPGGGGITGADEAARAAPDGYTLLAAPTPAFPLGPALYRAAQYNPVSSFTPIGIWGRGSPLLIVHPSIPARSVKDLVAMAKASPGSVTFAHSGAGGPSHLPTAMFTRATGIEIVEVPYKGEAPALPDLLGGRVTAMFAYLTMAVPQVKAGKVRALAYAGVRRNPALQEVPTVAESGYPGFEFHADGLLLGPAGLSSDIVLRLNREIAAIMAEADVQASYAAVGAETVVVTPEATARVIRRDVETLGALVKDLGIAPE